MERIRDFVPTSLVVVTGFLLSGCTAEPAGAPGGGMPPAKASEVFFATPTRDNLMDYEDCTGRTEAFKTVDVRARVTGYLDKWNFSPGKKVSKGDVLFEIDPRSYLAELARAEASVVQAEAHLTRLNADYQRAVNLYSTRAMVDPGNMVKADDTILTTIVTQDPIYAYFDIDERNALRLSRQLAQGEMKYPPVQMGLADEEPRFPHRGTIDFVDNRLDTNTGTWHMRCSFA